MDAGDKTGPTNFVSVTGAGYCLQATNHAPVVDPRLLKLECENAPSVDVWLKQAKTRKFMGVQDKLAVIAAGRALTDAKFIGENAEHQDKLQSNCGIYLSVGYIPFDYEEVHTLSMNSMENGRFSMQQFSTNGIDEVNPLLTFRCLPNMPAFHVSMNFNIQGPYFVSYPDIGQFYTCLQQATNALLSREIDIALVGGVADQENFLVNNQLKKLCIQEPYYNAAAFLVIERSDELIDNGEKRIELIGLKSDYQASDLLNKIPVYHENLSLNARHIDLKALGYLGPASLAMMLSSIKQQDAFFGEFQHRVQTSGNINARSHWQVVQ